MAKKLNYEVLYGTLHLANGVQVFGTGTTDDPNIIEQLRKLADVKDAMGNTQYVRVLDAAPAEVTGAVIAPDEGQVTTTTTVNADATVTEEVSVLKYPAGVNEKDVHTVQDALSAAGLTFKTANALSDEDIKAQTEGIGAARIKLIRAVGKENAYAEFAPDTTDDSVG